MKEHFFKFMQLMFDSDQVKLAILIKLQQEHPQKKGQICIVFAKCETTSLNDVLLSRPDKQHIVMCRHPFSKK